MGKLSKKRAALDSDSPDEKEAVVPSKSSKKVKTSKPSEGSSGQDAEGNFFWELSSKRRVTVSQFKGVSFVTIREYYEDKASGELKPGKKGISLTVEQYQALMRTAPAVNAALAKLGHPVSDVDSQEGHPPQVLKKESSSKEKRTKAKSNIEATSDEED